MVIGKTKKTFWTFANRKAYTTRRMQYYGIMGICRVATPGVEKFVFHNYRNTALTDWVDRGINVDAAMQASGHTSVQMHKRYLDLRRHHIAKAFGLANKLVDRDGEHSSSEEKRSGSK
jgi:integrase